MIWGPKIPMWGAIVGALGGGGGAAAGAGAGGAAATGAGAAGAAGAGAAGAAGATGGAGLAAGVGGGAGGAAATGAGAAAGGGVLGGIQAGAQQLYQMGETTKLDSFTDPGSGQIDVGSILSPQRREQMDRMRSAMSQIGEAPKHANVIGEVASRTKDSKYYGDPNNPQGTDQGDPLRDELMRRIFG